MPAQQVNAADDSTLANGSFLRRLKRWLKRKESHSTDSRSSSENARRSKKHKGRGRRSSREDSPQEERQP
eukprot:6838426-Alexandrium_andersonii.AAC.1